MLGYGSREQFTEFAGENPQNKRLASIAWYSACQLTDRYVSSAAHSAENNRIWGAYEGAELTVYREDGTHMVNMDTFREVVENGRLHDAKGVGEVVMKLAQDFLRDRIRFLDTPSSKGVL